MLMEWIEEYESGLPEIDVQHRQIFQLIQRVSALDAHNDRPGVRALVAQLEQVARHHFEQEERLMAACGYPDVASHAVDHAQLLLEVRGYQDTLAFNTRQLTLVLSNWLMSHTLMDDRPFAQYFLQLRAEGAVSADGLSNA